MVRVKTTGKTLTMSACIAIMSALFSLSAFATDYKGKVIGSNGENLMYATVYIQQEPEKGTATNAEGCFTLTTSLDTSATVIASYVGYEKAVFPLSRFEKSKDSLLVITLAEQPIALQETVVKEKNTKRSRRKLLAQILRSTYLKLLQDLPDSTTAYSIVSDVRLDAQDQPWGMEQMIATVIEQPLGGYNGKDSIQLIAEYCKRYCSPEVRQQLDNIRQNEKDKNRKHLAQTIDSGTGVHRGLWHMRLDPDHLLDTSNELKRWKTSVENGEQCVLTYTRKYDFMGMFKAAFTENLIINTADYTLKAYTVDMQMSFYLLFSYKMKGTLLDWINLFNINGTDFEKFKLRKGEMQAKVSTIYELKDGILIPREKNLESTGFVQDTKGNRVPISLKATQMVTDVKTTGIRLKKDYKKSAPVKREYVGIY